jgi:20S proteasome alpha/beta subunit
MANTHTLIAALKYQGGVIITSDTQVSDLPVQVRWPIEKLAQIGQHPLVVGFSDSMGQGQRARAKLDDGSFRSTTFEKPERVQRLMDTKLLPIYDQIKNLSRVPPGPHQITEIGLSALAAFWAGGEPHILEREMNCDSCFHSCFHAIGSGAPTAYAVYNTLGGKDELPQLEERKALMAMLRIVRTAIRVELMGVSEPLSVFIISDGKVRQLSEDEVMPNMQAVKEWEQGERDNFRRMKL